MNPGTLTGAKAAEFLRAESELIIQEVKLDFDTHDISSRCGDDLLTTLSCLGFRCLTGSKTKIREKQGCGRSYQPPRRTYRHDGPRPVCLGR